MSSQIGKLISLFDLGLEIGNRRFESFHFLFFFFGLVFSDGAAFLTSLAVLSFDLTNG